MPTRPTTAPLLQMNLSFVCYDNEEEPILYKSNSLSNDSTTNKEADNASDEWQTSNGFLFRDIVDPSMVSKTRTAKNNNSGSDSKYKHMISGRDFENILQACRPRNRGEHGSGLPLSLSILIKKSAASENNGVRSGNHSTPSQGRAIIDRISSQNHLMNESGQTSPQRMSKHPSKVKNLEWGAVNFENSFVSKGLQDDSGSQSSHSSSFASSSSLTLSLQQNNALGQLQSSLSLETVGREEADIPPNWMNDGTAIKKLMSEYDKKVFSLPSPLGKSAISTKTSCPSPLPSSHRASGIQAALEHYDGPKGEKESEVADPPGLVKTVSINDNSIIISERSLAVSPLGSLAMPYSFDGRRPPFRPSAMRLVVPEALPGSAYKPDINLLGSRRKSFSVLHDSFADHVGSANSMSRGKTLSVQQTANSRQLNRGERAHHQSTQRRRRKHWVLNPFRQDDEDEVLAKRTHNRRRWSHVFPLGEEVSVHHFNQSSR